MAFPLYPSFLRSNTHSSALSRRTSQIAAGRSTRALDFLSRSRARRTTLSSYGAPLITTVPRFDVSRLPSSIFERI